VLYTASTLYHSFFALRDTRHVFSILDHSAIYILIAGSYTPFLYVTFPDKPKWGTYLLAFIWLCASVGVGLEAFGQRFAWKSKVSLAMYLLMGWSALVAVPDFQERLSSKAVQFLLLGGCGYTGGVPFFVRNAHLDHSIWHLFVLAGSAAHWWCVYFHIIGQ